MKRFIEVFKKLPMPLAFSLFIGIPWTLAFLILRLFDESAGDIDTWADYAAMFLLVLPLLYLFVAQVIGPFLKKKD